MPENEFERNVRDKMDELNMRPSDAVWKGVEYELKKKKRRRVIFFISLLAGLSLAGWFSYTMISNNSDSHLTKTNNTINNTNINNKNSNPDTIHFISAKPKTQAIEEQPATKADQQNKKETVVIEKERDLKDNENEKSNIERNIKREINPVKKDEKLVIKRKDKDVKKIAGQEQKTTPEKKDNINAIDEKSEKKDRIKEKEEVKDIARNDIEAEKIKEERNIPDSSSQVLAIADTTAKIDSAVAVITAEQSKEQDSIAKAKSSSRIKWGVEFSGGVTSNRENALSLNTSKSLYDAGAYSAPGTGTGSSSGAPVTRPPSSIHSAPAFKIGLLAEMKLSERSSLSSGLRYSFMSEKIKIGANYYGLGNYSQFGLADRIYLSTQEKTYYNNYHFIEIPLTYRLQLNKGNKTGIILSGGISAGYLISTNSLIYDSLAGGIYYRDKQAFNKFHFNFNTGLALRFGAGKLKWTIGPDLSLDMTRLTKQDAYIQKRYLLYGGLTGRLIFSSGKK